MSHRNLRLQIVCLTLVMIAGSAAAAVLLNPPRRWFPEDLARNVVVDNRGMSSVTTSDNGIAAARAAVTAWNGSGAGNILSSSTGAPNLALGDGQSHLLFDDPLRICKGQCLAATTTGYYDSGQPATCGGLSVVRITDSDIVFNTRYDYTTADEGGCSGEIFLESVVTHEVGHLIGLAHSQVGSALMAPSVAYCDNKTITADDRSGRDALYNCAFNGGGGGGGGSCNNNGVCESGEDCTNCGDCEGRTGGRPSNRYCCGDGTQQSAEGNGAICDGNY